MKSLLLATALILLPSAAMAACRSYNQTVMVSNETVETHGVTCQAPTGPWHVQTRLDPNEQPVGEHAFEEPMTFGAVVNYPNAVFKYVKILPDGHMQDDIQTR